MIGQQVGTYHIEAKIGSGAMGTVFRALDTRSGKTVAIKQLKSDIANPENLERFKREGRALRTLNHPNIVAMLDALTIEDIHYLVMEYINGHDLAHYLKQDELEITQLLNLAIDLADALTRAHRIDIIHRDLKPANILIRDDGILKLTDFGVAHLGDMDSLTDPNALIGTVNYMPPEVFRGERFSTAGDIWAFGVILFEMLTGIHPFKSLIIMSTIQKITSGQVPDLEALRPDCPSALIDLVYRMVERNPQARLASVRHVGALLEDILQNRTPVSETRFQTSTSEHEILSRHNLPAQTTPFIGRESELATIATLLDIPTTRLITILAPGGMGKTRLALEAALQQITHYDDGVFLVELAPLDDASDIVTEITGAIGYQIQSGGRTPQQELLDYLANKQILLVLDNFEHVLDGSSIVAAILKSASEAKIIATSRERLNQSGETVFTLGGMPQPDWQTLEEAQSNSAALLFMQSARRVQPDFEFTADNIQSIAAICRLVDGLPLGILLAASWLGMLTPDEIVTEIEDSIDFLSQAMGDMPERQRSIRAVFDYSWNLLESTRQDIFMKLSIFKGGFTRDAVKAITGANLRDLITLINKSLITRNTDSGRYQVHELTRQYAADRLVASSEYSAVANAHSIYYADFISGCEEDLTSPAHTKTLKAVNDDLENIKLAVQSAITSRSDSRLMDMIQPLAAIYNFNTLLNEGTQLFQQMMDAAYDSSATEQSDLYWQARSFRYFTYHFHENSHTLIANAQESLSKLQERQMELALVRIKATEAYAYIQLGDFGAAYQHADAGNTLADKLDDIIGRYYCQGNMAYALYLDGQATSAIDIQRATIDEIESYGEIPLWLSFAYHNLGEFSLAVDNPQAKEYFDKSLKYSQMTNNHRFIAYSLMNLGRIAQAQHDLETALNYNTRSVNILRDIGDKRSLSDALLRQAELHHLRGDLPEAREDVQEAITICETTGNSRILDDARTLLATLKNQV